MASITIRNLDETAKQALRERAAKNGHSMEEEARLLLSASNLPEPQREALANASDISTKELLKQKIAVNDLYGSKYASYEYELEWLNIRLSTKESVYEQAKADAKTNVDAKGMESE